MTQVADFFAGIGLVRYALERTGWKEIYAIDYNPEKQRMYEGHFGKSRYELRDIRTLSGKEVPTVALAHASFPCSDTSVAGRRGGLSGKESSNFWQVVRILHEMRGRKPPLVLFENVEGFLTSNSGNDIKKALEALASLGYSVDLLLIDASHFVPQSRVRLFIVGAIQSEPQNLIEQEWALNHFTEARPKKITNFIRKHGYLPWYIQQLPSLPQRSHNLESIVDITAPWWPTKRSEYLYNQMFERHQIKVHEMMAKDEYSYGTVFRRMRIRDGKNQSTAELRVDGVAGCLRTPKGGSARQILLRAGQKQYDARLLNARECARLMGADDYFIDEDLPLSQALYGFGDAVCVPVIEWISAHYLSPVYQEMHLPDYVIL